MSLSTTLRLARIAAAAALALAAGAVHAADMTFLMTNRTAAPVDVALFGRDRVLPAEGQAYRLDEGAEMSVPVSCAIGETICYGAWVVGDEASFWGVGRYNDTPCETCCNDCTREGGAVEIDLAR